MLEVGLAMNIATFIGFVYSVVLHEVAHALAAKWCGDDTAERDGRITLDPIPHIDPMMTILVPLMLYWLSNGQFCFGGARPVPVRIERLRHPRTDMALVAAAGPISNILIAAAIFLSIRLGLLFSPLDQELTSRLISVGMHIALLNIFLASFNLIPWPPLDGSKMIAAFLPAKVADRFLGIDQFASLSVLILLMYTGAGRSLVDHISRSIMALLMGLLG